MCRVPTILDSSGADPRTLAVERLQARVHPGWLSRRRNWGRSVAGPGRSQSRLWGERKSDRPSIDHLDRRSGLKIIKEHDQLTAIRLISRGIRPYSLDPGPRQLIAKFLAGIVIAGCQLLRGDAVLALHHRVRSMISMTVTSTSTIRNAIGSAAHRATTSFHAVSGVEARYVIRIGPR
jgi:hypothetical protein